MKKVKIVFGVIVFGLIGFFVYQNRSFLFYDQEIVFNIVYGSPYKFELPVVIYFLTFFLVGFLIAYFFSLSERFKSKKTIRRLNDMLDVEKKKILELENRTATAPRSVSSDIYMDTEKQTDAVVS